MFLNGKTTLYHGTAHQHDYINLSECKKYGDFGKGYYLTTLFRQANQWARNKCYDKYYYIYEYNVIIPNKIDITELPLLHYDSEWANIIAYCRQYGEVPYDIQINKKVRNPGDYDIIYDRMADNNGGQIAKSISDYLKGKIIVEDVLLTIAQRWKRDQYCFKTQKAITLLQRKRIWIFNKSGVLIDRNDI